MRSFSQPVRASLMALAAVAALGLGACSSQPTYQYHAGAVPPPPPPPPPVQPAPTRYVLQADTLFAFDSSDLRPEGQRRLADIAAKIRNTHVRTIIVLGYTDRIGSADYNMDLSRRRAGSARAALVADGVPADWIQAHGRGASDPRVSCDDQSGDALIACLAPNRRVEIIVDAVSP